MKKLAVSRHRLGIEKAAEHESDCNTNWNWCTCYYHQGISTNTGGLGNKRRSGGHQNYCIIQIDQNTEKSRGDLSRGYHSNSCEKPSANAAVKNS